MAEPPLTAPERIGRYDVERLLGQGGMGRVWLARDTVLGRHVAVKVLRDDLALPAQVRNELVLRMRHEARAAAAMSHPNIVTLHDMGEDAEVGLFLVFEYVPAPHGPPTPVLSRPPPAVGAASPATEDEASESLRDRLRRGPLPLMEVAKLGRELGNALSFAHEAGVIHRDVKPENVLFSRTGAKIADFGIARIPDSTLTRANTVLGTPAYTAPEALSKGEFGPASDQFSLAATLYEAATAARAFGGEDALVTAGKVSSEPPPPLHESIGNAATLRALETALRRGLAKDPKTRFASCAALGEEVARAIEPKMVPAPPEPPPISARLSLSDPYMDKPRTEQPELFALDSPRPSIFIRKRRQRFQNVLAATALVVIVVLVLVGRKSAEDAAAQRELVKSATPPASSSAPPPPPPPRPKPHRPPTVTAKSASSVGVVVEDAGPVVSDE